MTEVNLNNNIWQQPQGFLWYNDQQVEETNKLPSHDASSLLHLKQESYNEPYDQRIKDLKQKFNRAQRQALDNPTLTNVIIAQRLHLKNLFINFGMLHPMGVILINLENFYCIQPCKK
ncbi:conjugal transfer protein TraF [Rickettsia rhipicephali]|uniref:conjugal transfer protein TraF n=1 Tax=Rickettsia rhipicephali TaxID=33992 RepID=UPI00224ED3FD|nr:conjugal transfer protein TraF [Rickettsia rhipicephali]MCX4079896.1 conjugal transfer protein TraF [Rickettsia rhipicephali]